MAKRKKKIRFTSPDRALLEYIGRFQTLLYPAMQRYGMVVWSEKVSPRDTHSTQFFRFEGSKTILVDREIRCDFVKGRARRLDDIEFRIRYRWRLVGKKKQSTRTLRFEKSESTDEILMSVAADMAKKAGIR